MGLAGALEHDEHTAENDRATTSFRRAPDGRAQPHANHHRGFRDHAGAAAGRPRSNDRWHRHAPHRGGSQRLVLLRLGDHRLPGRLYRDGAGCRQARGPVWPEAILLTGMVGFVVASALCGLSQNMTELIIFRTIQGIFGGVLFATVFAVIGDLFPPQQRARVGGLFGAVFGLSSVLGPTAGGYITDNLGWRWVFYVNLPIGILAVLIVAATLPFVRSKASVRDIDFPGAAALVAGLIPLM